MQSYMLPDDVVKDQISAKVDAGILTITMPAYGCKVAASGG